MNGHHYTGVTGGEGGVKGAIVYIRKGSNVETQGDTAHFLPPDVLVKSERKVTLSLHLHRTLNEQIIIACSFSIRIYVFSALATVEGY